MIPPGQALTGRVVLGGAHLSLADDRSDHESVHLIRAAADAGISIFDSARAYAPVGEPLHNERLFATALSGRTDVLIGTKGGHFRTGPQTWGVDNSPARLRQDVDDSLHALGVEQLPLYYLHRADDVRSIEQSVAALDELRSAGKIHLVGLSNVTTDQLDESLRIARVDAVQNLHSVAGRESRHVLQRCEELGVAFFAYSALRGGGTGAAAAHGFPRTQEVALRRGVSLQRLLLRAHLASSPVLSVIVGAGRMETIRDAAAVAAEPWDDDLASAFAHDRAAH